MSDYHIALEYFGRTTSLDQQRLGILFLQSLTALKNIATFHYEVFEILELTFE